MAKPTIGSKNSLPFEQRGAKRPIQDQAKYPRVTQSPQQYGHGVTPQNAVRPDDGTYRAGYRPTGLNVGRPSGRKDPAPNYDNGPYPNRRSP